MLRKVIEFLVVKLRGRALILHPSIGNYELLTLLFRQGVCLCRGVVRTRTFASLGRAVILTSKKNLFLSKGVTIGHYCNIDALGLNGLYIGRSSSIGAFSQLKVSGSLGFLGKGITIGSNVGIGEFSHIGGAGGVEIGDDTIVGSYFSVHPENHNFEDITLPIRLQGVTHQGICVGNGCWIGAKVTLLDGTTIGNGCVVAAGAVVKGKFPDNCVIGGVPARILKKR